MTDILNDGSIGAASTKLKGWPLGRGLVQMRKLPQVLWGFATELSSINLAFWNRSPATLRKRVYLTTVAAVAILGARSAFAASANPVQVPGVCFGVVCAALIGSGLGFVADPRYRRFASRFSPSCYRVLITLVILSAAIIATNLGFQWSTWISAGLGFTADGIWEKAIGVVLPASSGSFLFVFLTSFLDPKFRRSWDEERARVIGWSVYLFVLSFLLTLGVFADGVISDRIFG